MKKVISYFVMTALAVGLFSACGSNQKEKKQQQQARRDSLAQIRKQKRKQQARRDSIRQAHQDSALAAAKKNKPKNNNEQMEPMNVSYSSNGAFAVMTESWRSKIKAKKRVQAWKKRGFDHVSYVKFGDEQYGDVWYRIRLGRVNSRDMAQKLQKNIDQKYKANSWVTSVK